MCYPVLIKAVCTLLLCVICLIFIFLKRKTNKKIDTILGVIFTVACLVIGVQELYHSMNPKIENVTVCLESYNRPLHKLGSECTFNDADGNQYILYIDPITRKSALGNRDLIKSEIYDVTYEKNENTVVTIKEHSK